MGNSRPIIISNEKNLIETAGIPFGFSQRETRIRLVEEQLRMILKDDAYVQFDGGGWLIEKHHRYDFVHKENFTETDRRFRPLHTDLGLTTINGTEFYRDLFEVPEEVFEVFEEEEDGGKQKKFLKFW